MKGIMVMGTASDAGKSMVCTALCRLLSDEGVHAAPFKSQNMSRHVCTLPDGSEISRSQYIQAVACRTEPSVDMNPIILKPSGPMQSEVVFRGKPLGAAEGMAYRERFMERGIEAIRESLSVLSGTYDAVVIEGAGSPAEVNLNDREVVNFRVAELADVPVLLIADIERGGAIASIVGTLALLTESRRNRVKGILINKFHGDVSLFADGVAFLEEYTGIPVAGVIPHMEDLHFSKEDLCEPYDRWAAHVRAHIDFAYIRQLIEKGSGR